MRAGKIGTGHSLLQLGASRIGRTATTGNVFREGFWISCSTPLRKRFSYPCQDIVSGFQKDFVEFRSSNLPVVAMFTAGVLQSFLSLAPQLEFSVGVIVVCILEGPSVSAYFSDQQQQDQRSSCQQRIPA